MLLRVSDDLGWGIEAHGLGVEQGAGEDLGVVLLHPRTGVDQQGEGRRVALGKTVAAKALDLLETPLGKGRVVAPRRHALAQLVTETVQHAALLEGRHGPAQLVSLARGEAGCDDGNLHRLLLEQRHTEGLAQHTLELGRGKLHRLLAVAAAQVGVDHVALDRPGPDDGDLDHQIVEGAGPEPGQHVHLRSAFDLKHTQRVPPRQHLVDRRVFRRDARQRMPFAVVLLEQLETAAHARQHAQR